MRQTGIGQDKDLLNLRHRSRNILLIMIAGSVLALILSFLLLKERTGSLLVKADHPDAVVVLNGSITTTLVGTPIKKLHPDTYRVSVHLPGHQSEPDERVVKINAGKLVEVSFGLKEKAIEETPPPVVEEKSLQPPIATPRASAIKKQAQTSTENNFRQPDTEKQSVGTLKVETSPVDGGIFVDDVFMGLGKATLTDVPLGEAIIRFGEVDGFRTPDPEKAILTPDWPYASIKATYLPLIYISCYIDPNGRIVTNKCEVEQGFVIEGQESLADPTAGPGIKRVEEVPGFLWEIGYAFSNRNPPGEDFIELVFELPNNWDGNKPLDLHLYGFGSDKRYPFALSGKTGIDLIVNSKVIKQNYQPQTTLSSGTAMKPEVFHINSFLRSGTNTIRIKTSSSSRCFYYLQQIALL